MAEESGEEGEEEGEAEGEEGEEEGPMTALWEKADRRAEDEQTEEAYRDAAKAHRVARDWHIARADTVGRHKQAQRHEELAEWYDRMAQDSQENRPRLSFQVMPHITPELFTRMFNVAKRKWPRVELGYVGTDEKGNHYMQERGNETPFIITKEEMEEER